MSGTLTPSDADRDQSDASAIKPSVSEIIDCDRLREVVVAGADLNGVLRGKRVPAADFMADPRRPVQLSDYIFALDVADAAIEGRAPAGPYWPFAATGYRDTMAVADLSTLRRVPWLPHTAVTLADFQFSDGSPVSVSPRAVLQRVLRRAAEQGLTVKIGAELEFFAYRETPQSMRAKGFQDLQPLSSTAQAYSVLVGDEHAALLDRFCENLVAFGLPVEAVSVEAGAGQLEVNVVYAEALVTADRTVLLKMALKELALQEGLIATSMARPPGTAVGNSLHIHVSLWRDGESLMPSTQGDGLSATARHVIGGQVGCFRDLAVLFAPTENSYKRYVPGSGAGGVAAWGAENWTAGIRVVGQGTSACRVENRVPGGDANPYLAIAGVVAAALHGVDAQKDPGLPVVGDASLSGAAPMRISLTRAIDDFTASPVAREYLGEDFVAFYAATREWEANAARVEATPWETARYLEAL